jgi:hypothetical protein
MFASPVLYAVPGVVVNYSPASSGIYIGSPGIAILPNGDYIATHDRFGTPVEEQERAATQVFRSTDRGQTWSHLATVPSMYWASVFVHHGELYLLGASKVGGFVVIKRSVDGGKTWSVAQDGQSGILLDDARFSCGALPVVVHNGRIWHAMEDTSGPGGWGEYFRAFMMSAPADCNLLDADNWTHTNRLTRDPSWLNGKFNGWLEGNTVVTPDGHIVDILRTDYRPEGGKAAVITISDDGRNASFDPTTGFIDFPGGCKKFVIRFDPVSQKYWALSNPVLPRHVGGNPERTRNALGLMCSENLRNWTLRCVVLYHPHTNHYGFQYPDWLFDGEDIIVVSRTAYGEGEDAAHNQHDANYLTFHRLKNFRTLTMADSADGAKPGQEAWQTPSDLSAQKGLSEVQFDYIPVWAREFEPASGATDVAPDVTLSWRPGRDAVQHEVYLGLDANELSLARTTAETHFDTRGSNLLLGQTYYWQVVEVNETAAIPAWAGAINSFSTKSVYMIDDFESYDNDSPSLIYQTWQDGYGYLADEYFSLGYNGNGTGARLGHDIWTASSKHYEGDIMEKEMVYAGKQSAPFYFDGMSEMTRVFDEPWDFTAHGVQGLVVHSWGDTDNTATSLYVEINDTKIAYDGDASALMSAGWTTWYIALAGLTTVNLTNVRSLTIGVASGKGLLYVDDILLAPAEPED